MAGDDLSALQDRLEERGIHAIRAAPMQRHGFEALAMSTYSVQEFLNVLFPGPMTDDDRLAMRALGRGTDLGPSDTPWRFEAVPTAKDFDSPMELRIIVEMPKSDIAEVLARFGGG